MALVYPLEVAHDPFPLVRRIDPALSPAIRQDGWQNTLTGFGTTRDKTTASFFVPENILDPLTLEWLYYHDPIAAIIVDVLVEEMFRKGWVIEDENEELEKYAADLCFVEKLQDAIVWGRAYGGSLLVFGLNDGAASMAEPLNEENVREIRWLQEYDNRDAFVHRYNEDTSSKDYLKPEIYRLGDPIYGRVSYVHASRCIHINGTKVDRRKRIELKGWGYSVLQRPYETMREFENSYAAISGLVVDASQAVYGIQDLEAKISHNQEDLQTRMQLVETSRSTMRAVIIDAEKESFQRVATSFAGLPDVLDRFMQKLSAVTRIPVSILMGRSPAGMNATGDSDWQGFYDYVARLQQKDLLPLLKRGYHLLSLAKDGPGGGVPFEQEIKFKPLKEMTEKERAELEKSVAEKDKIQIDSGVVYAEEVALARYGEKEGHFSVRAPTIDVAMRKKMLANEQELTLNPPPPPKVVVGAPGMKPPNAQPTPAVPPKE